MTRTKTILFALILTIAASAFASTRTRAARADAGGDVVRGVITAVRGNVIEIAHAIDIDVTGAILVSSGRSITASEIVPGSLANVIVNRDGNVLRAQVVAIEPANEVTIVGRVEAVNASAQTITVVGEPIRIDSTTLIVPATPLTAITPGQRVVITAVSEGNSLRAIRLVVAAARPGGGGLADFFEGVVEEIGTTQWRISGRTFAVGPETLVLGSPRVGDPVIVLVDPASPNVARMIIARDAGAPVAPAQVVFEGRVESITNSLFGPMWRVNGRDVLVSPGTVVVGNPGAGDLVRVTGVALPNFRGVDTVAATRIEKL